MIGAPQRWWRAWVGLIATREPGTTLALFRIAVGLLLTWSWVEPWASGVVPMIWIGDEWGGVRALGHSWLFDLLGGASPTAVYSVIGLTALSGLALTLGLFSRPAALIGLVGGLELSRLNGHAAGSYDNLFSNALWLLVLARADATLSLRCRLRTGRWTSDLLVAAWPRWLLILQLVTMYCSTGLQKVSSHWVPGGDLAALYLILQQPTWQRFGMAWVADFYPLTQAATLLVWLFEVGAPLLLIIFWARHGRSRGGRLRAALNRFDLRKPFALYGLSMHAGIMATMEVGPFSPLSMAFYIALVHPREWPWGAGEQQPQPDPARQE